MACDVVSAVILSLPSRKELKMQSPRVAVVKKCIEDVLEACSKEQNQYLPGGMVFLLWHCSGDI